MKLSSMKFKDIRCVFYYADGKVKVSHDTNKVAQLEKEGRDFVVLNNPNVEQKKVILSKIYEQNGKLEMQGLDVLECIKLLTNIELDITEEEALELIKNPDEMLEAIALECNIITLNLIKNQMKEVDAIASLPDSVKTPILEEAEAKIKEEEEKAKQAEEEAKRIEEEMKQLEKQMKELKKKRKVTKGE